MDEGKLCGPLQKIKKSKEQMKIYWLAILLSKQNIQSREGRGYIKI